LEDGYPAVSAVPGGWEFLKKESPPEDRGFMFWGHPTLQSIANGMEIGHSGGSFAFTMRLLEFIANKGWQEFYTKYIYSL
jgi:hypothetical protein